MKIFLNFVHTHVDNRQCAFYLLDLLLVGLDLLEEWRNLVGKERIVLAQVTHNVSQHLL